MGREAGISPRHKRKANARIVSRCMVRLQSTRIEYSVREWMERSQRYPPTQREEHKTIRESFRWRHVSRYPLEQSKMPAVARLEQVATAGGMPCSRRFDR